MAHERSTVKRCLAALALLEVLEEEDDRVTKRGKTRNWIKRRGEKGYFNNIVTELMVEDTAAYREMMRMNHEDFKRLLKAIEPDITPRQVMGGHKVIAACLYADVGTNGRVSDGGVWNKCGLSQAIEDEIISLPPPHIPAMSA